MKNVYEIESLRAKLASVEKERDEEHEINLAMAGSHAERVKERDATNERVKERDATNERVKALEADLTQALSDLAFVDRALVVEIKSHAAARDLAEKLEAALEATGFEDAWAEKQAEGYQYGGDALDNVYFGWKIAFAAIRARAGLTKEGR